MQDKTWLVVNAEVHVFDMQKAKFATCDVYVGGKVRVSEFMIFLDLQHCGSK